MLLSFAKNLESFILFSYHLHLNNCPHQLLNNMVMLFDHLLLLQRVLHHVCFDFHLWTFFKDIEIFPPIVAYPSTSPYPPPPPPQQSMYPQLHVNQPPPPRQQYCPPYAGATASYSQHPHYPRTAVVVQPSSSYSTGGGYGGYRGGGGSSLAGVGLGLAGGALLGGKIDKNVFR